MSILLRDFIRSLRQCKTAQQERDVVLKESAALREAFKDPDTSLRRRNVTKLMYIHMLGFPTHFGQMEALKLIAHHDFFDKRIGYLGLMVLLDEKQEVLMLVTNSIKQDLNQRNQYIAGLALTALGNIASAEMARDLAPEVLRLMNSNSAYIRKKAALCAGRIILKVPEMIDDFIRKAADLLNDRHHGVLLTGVTLMLDICEAHRPAIEEYRRDVPMLCRILKSLLVSGLAAEHDVGGITDPFLQVKILRLLRHLGRGSAESSDQMSDILAQVASNTESNRNAGYAILYEAVQTIMDIESIGGLRVLAVNILGRFLANRDNNVRYVALESLAKVVAEDAAAVQRHRTTIVECVKDADVSIRRKALELVYALVNENNIQTLTRELLDYLRGCDPEFKADLTAKICLLAHTYAPDKRWYMDTIVEVLVQGGACVQEEVVRALLLAISNAPHLQPYAVRLLYRSCRAHKEEAAQPLLLAALWCIGEYGEQLLPGAGREYLEGEEPLAVCAEEVVALVEGVLKGPGEGQQQLREYALTALIKLSARLPAQCERIKRDIRDNCSCIVLEVQQRACEYNGMFKYPMRSQLVEPVPPLDESTYSGNLIKQGVVDQARTQEELAAAGLENGPTLKSSTRSDLLDLLSTDDTAAPLAAPAAPVMDLLGDLLSSVPSAPLPDAAPALGTAMVNGNSLGDMLGDLLGPAAPPPMTVWDKNGIKITFSLSKPPGQPGLTRISACSTNQGTAAINNFTLQAAVPKFMQIKLEPASGHVLPPQASGSVTQVLLVNNSMQGQKALVMRLRITYSVNGAQVVEQAEVNNFPSGY